MKIEQINALYNKAQKKKNADNSEPEITKASFGNTLMQTIESVNEISHQADTALKALSTTSKGEINAKIAQVGSIHKKIMEAQHDLAALYNKLQVREDG